MKTAPWTPPKLEDGSFTPSVDEMVIFSSAELKFEKSSTLLAALLVGTGYASLGIGFEIKTAAHETVLVFTPGQEVRAIPELRQAILDISLHIDHQVRAAVEKTSIELKERVMQQFDAVVEAEVQRRLGGAPAEAAAQADPAPEAAVPAAQSPDGEPAQPEAAQDIPNTPKPEAGA